MKHRANLTTTPETPIDTHIPPTTNAHHSSPSHPPNYLNTPPTILITIEPALIITPKSKNILPPTTNPFSSRKRTSLFSSKMKKSSQASSREQNSQNLIERREKSCHYILCQTKKTPLTTIKDYGSGRQRILTSISKRKKIIQTVSMLTHRVSPPTITDTSRPLSTPFESKNSQTLKKINT